MKNFLKKQWSNILFGAFILAFFFVPGVRESIQRLFLMKPSLEESQSIGTLSESEYNVELKGINVPDANLSDFKGKPIFLNFWGSWCPPCRAEFPTIQSLYEGKKSKIEFVLIAMQDEEQKVRDFIKKNGYTTPVYLLKEPLSEKFSIDVFLPLSSLGRMGRYSKKMKEQPTGIVKRFIVL